MAYRVVSESAQRVQTRTLRLRGDRPLTRNAAIAAASLLSISLAAAGAAIFGNSRGFEAPAQRTASPRSFQIALVDPAPPKVVRRDPRVAIATPGPHNVRIAVASIPLPRARPAQMAAIALPPETIAEATSAPDAAGAIAAKTGTPAMATQESPAELAGAPPAVPLPAARPVQLASVAAAAGERGADPETTGSIGDPAHETAGAEAKADTRVLAAARPARETPTASSKPDRKPNHAIAAPEKPAHKSFFASLFKPARTPFEKLYGPVRVASLTPAYTGREDDAGLPRAPYDRHTAVYVIASKKVYMPDGTVLEAHSGYGDRLDDPRFVNVRMRGATPPHVYDLKLRENLFHGVEAIRLNPIGGDGGIFGRDGLLAHTYMLGPRGDSNGCVSFRNYDAFLRAFKEGRITRLAVITRLD